MSYYQRVKKGSALWSYDVGSRRTTISFPRRILLCGEGVCTPCSTTVVSLRPYILPE